MASSSPDSLEEKAKAELLARWGCSDGDALCAALRADGAVIAGSAALHAYLGARGHVLTWEPRDADVWSEAPLTHMTAWLQKHGATDATDVTHRSGTSSERARLSILELSVPRGAGKSIKFQLIHVGPLYGTEAGAGAGCEKRRLPFCPAAEFDLGCCACVFDGDTVTLPPSAIFNEATLTARMVRAPATCEAALACLVRADKYRARGITVDADDLARAEALCRALEEEARAKRETEVAAKKAAFVALSRAERIEVARIRDTDGALDAECMCVECAEFVGTRHARAVTRGVLTTHLEPLVVASQFRLADHTAAICTWGRECFACGATVCSTCLRNPALWNVPPIATASHVATAPPHAEKEVDEGEAKDRPTKRAKCDVTDDEALEYAVRDLGGWQYMMCRPCADAMSDVVEKQAAAKVYCAAAIKATKAQIAERKRQEEQEERERQVRKETHDIAGLDRVMLLVMLWCHTGSVASAFGPAPTDEDARAALGDGSAQARVDYWFGRPIKVTFPPVGVAGAAGTRGGGDECVNFVAYNDNAQRHTDCRVDEAGRVIARMRGQDAREERWTTCVSTPTAAHIEATRANSVFGNPFAALVSVLYATDAKSATGAKGAKGAKANT